ncbi:hypothetical protein BHE90_001046 [Fusarium euwallaceae]|uniref:Zn(2)-C6 fungal-type domain-containing protein n=1 Tax=Fusarium euwallaceae TaxID=1147111 RepID=A0A430M8W3_9HYPO|nr:hypothetical protein BHE90_001046 [Fusarium euwallaceae]
MTSHNSPTTTRPNGGGQVPFPKPRGVTACEKCRLRKTRCDNRRPTCGFCLRRHLVCVYPDEEDAGSVTGAEILQAIHKLTRLVESQQPLQHYQQQSPAQAMDSSPFVPQSVSEHHQLGAPEGLPHHATVRPQGVESILDWEIFAPDRPTQCLFAQRNPPSMGSYSLPDTSYPQLARLESKYIDTLHTKNPILDLSDLHRMILQVAEDGLDWSTQTCLVALVCANAAITEPYPESIGEDEMSLSSTPDQKAREKAELDLSMQFWNVAIKRLGYASGQSSVQAVQCLCLAGIWYMHRLEPLEAWKHFSLAGTAWHSLSLTHFPHGELINQADSSSNELTIMQALYFTIWKSECELRLELPLPSPSVLDNAYFPLAFPQPPSLGSHPLDPDTTERERSWYYYLSEIAARHLINRLLQMNSEVPTTPTEKQVRRMISQAEMMETQIFDWYSSLPPIFYFDIPEGYQIGFHPNAMIFVLRHRYFTLRELVSRPFVRLCVDRLVDGMDPSLYTPVTSFASQCLQFCMLKLGQVVGHRHQGAWYTIRMTTSSCLTLAAVHRAQRQAEECQAVRIVQNVILPETWRDRVRQAVDSNQPQFDEPNGGASNLKLVVGAILESSLDYPTPLVFVIGEAPRRYIQHLKAHYFAKAGLNRDHVL